MPLNRDQTHELTVRSAVPSAPTERQRTYSTGSGLSLRSEPSTPQNGMNNSSVRRDHANPNVPGGNRKQHIIEEGLALVQPTAMLFKIPAPDTMQKHQLGKSQRSNSTRAQPVIPRQENTRFSTSVVKRQRAEHQITSAFDDTGSLGPSMLDENPDDDRAALVQPPRAEQYSTRETTYAHEHDPRNDYSLEEIMSDYPDWQKDVADEGRRLEGKQGFTSDTGLPRGKGGQADSRHSILFVPRHGELQEPETPTRAHSAPPVKAQLHAPAPQKAPHKSVNFVESNNIQYFSPEFRSSEFGQDDRFEQSISRPNSAQPRVQALPDQRTLRMQQHLQKQSRQSQSAIPSEAGRFHQPSEHLQVVRQEDQKVSAPESDNQDHSEDERTQTQQHYNRQDKPPGSDIVDSQSLPPGKRSHDDMRNGLDYSQDELKKKSLAALQAEAFTRDPRASLQSPPTDSVGNEMTLAQILENLSKVPEDAQRETFKSLTDEQWARTGQWFVDKFQTDLIRLTDIRLQRRKIALKYENEIKRRQCLVEHLEAEVDRELQELQSGGSQLVNGRKVPSGSRSATPMRSGR